MSKEGGKSHIMGDATKITIYIYAIYIYEYDNEYKVI